MASSAGENGGTRESFRTSSSLAANSTSPVGILGLIALGVALTQLALRGHDILRTHVLGLRVTIGREVLIEDNLGDAGAVAEIEEDEVAVIAAAIDPAHQDDIFAGIAGAKLTAGMGAL